MRELFNQMGPFYQSPYEEGSVNDNIFHNISTTTSTNAVTMDSIKQILRKMLQIIIQNQMA